MADGPHWASQDVHSRPDCHCRFVGTVCRRYLSSAISCSAFPHRCGNRRRLSDCHIDDRGVFTPQTSCNVDGHDRCRMVPWRQCRSSCGLRTLRDPSRLALDAGIVCDSGSTDSYWSLGYPRISKVVGIEGPSRRGRSRCHEALWRKCSSSCARDR